MWYKGRRLGCKGNFSGREKAGKLWKKAGPGHKYSTGKFSPVRPPSSVLVRVKKSPTLCGLPEYFTSSSFGRTVRILVYMECWGIWFGGGISGYFILYHTYDTGIYGEKDYHDGGLTGRVHSGLHWGE